MSCTKSKAQYVFHKNSSNASSSRDAKSAAAAFRDELYYNKSGKNKNEGMPSVISNNWGSSGIGETFLETVLDTVARKWGIKPRLD